MTQTIEFHPFANEYPLADDATLAVIVADMKARGYDPRFPIVTFGGQILDGRNRAKAADVAGVIPTYAVFDGSEDDARAFVARANENRRHLVFEWLAARRAERLVRVADAHASGKSTRKIAATECVSQTQIVRDLEDVKKDAKPEARTGDGSGDSAYGNNTDTESPSTSKKPKKQPILCFRCATKPKPEPKCDGCKKARAAAKLKSDIDKANSEPEKEKPEATIDDTIKAKNGEIESFARKLAAMIDDIPDDPWLDKDNRKGGIAQKIKDACSAIRSCKCKEACPMCKGDGCAKCCHTGRVPHYTYQQLVG